MMLLSAPWQAQSHAIWCNVAGGFQEWGGSGCCHKRRVWRTARCAINGPVSQVLKQQQAETRKESNGSVAPAPKRSLHLGQPNEKRFVKDEVMEGPPQWFCPQVTTSSKDVPVMLYLPGMDGSGRGLFQHHESLASLFELRCLRISVRDRTPFPALLKIVESAVIEEARRRPWSPVYFVGEGLGGALALAIAARNPALDLLLILVNPATSFPDSPLHSLVPLLSNLPWEHPFGVPSSLLNVVLGGPFDLPQGNVSSWGDGVEMSKDTVLWKVKMLGQASAYANSRLHAVKAEVLVLASGNDRVLPSSSEADKLKKLIKGCRVRKFPQSGHNLLQEREFDLATVIKAAGCYRQSNKWDPVLDFAMVTDKEAATFFDKNVKLFQQLTSPVFFSTSEGGEVVQGLSNIPTDRPIMLVGYHMFLGIELGVLVSEIFKEKNILLRGLAHPGVVGRDFEGENQPDPSNGDGLRLFGAVPSYGRSMYRLLQHGHSTLLYPGGTREALHRKGEEYKLFWPEKSEFVQMAVRHGVTIIPFGGIGEDDLFNIVLDLNDLRKFPALLEMLSPKNMPLLRQNLNGEIADQAMHLPLALPKGIGRLYFLFQKPIVLAGREEEFRDRNKRRLSISMSRPRSRLLCIIYRSRGRRTHTAIFCLEHCTSHRWDRTIKHLPSNPELPTEINQLMGKC